MSQSLLRLSPKAIRYACEQIVMRAGKGCAYGTDGDFDAGGFKIHYRKPEHVKPEDRAVIVVPCREGALRALLGLKQNSLHWIPAERIVPEGLQLPFSDPVPVIFWGAGYEDCSKPFAERRVDGSIIFYADIVAATFFMLSRWEETVVPTRDQHHRFPATASVAYKQGFVHRPIVDEYALIFQAWMKTLLPGWKPKQRQFVIKLSHDIDKVREVNAFRQGVRNLLGDLLKRRNASVAFRTLRAMTNSSKNSLLKQIYELADLSERYNFKSSFYFMGADPGRYDTGYDPSSPQIRQCVKDLSRRGHEVGFHAGYNTLYDLQLFLKEKARVEDGSGMSLRGGRQHYGRFSVPMTWRMWEKAGMAYDSTLTYVDHEAFRCGTCHAFRPFDVELDRELGIIEIPLIIMDGALKDFGGLTPEQGQDRILALAQRCKQVKGTFSLLWHNSSLHGDWGAWGNMYKRTLPLLAEMERAL